MFIVSCIRVPVTGDTTPNTQTIAPYNIYKDKTAVLSMGLALHKVAGGNFNNSKLKATKSTHVFIYVVVRKSMHSS